MKHLHDFSDFLPFDRVNTREDLNLHHDGCKNFNYLMFLRDCNIHTSLSRLLLFPYNMSQIITRYSDNVFIPSVNQGSSERFLLLTISGTSYYLLCVSQVELKLFNTHTNTSTHTHTHTYIYIYYLRSLKFTVKHLKRSYMYRSNDHPQGTIHAP